MLPVIPFVRGTDGLQGATKINNLDSNSLMCVWCFCRGMSFMTPKYIYIYINDEKPSVSKGTLHMEIYFKGNSHIDESMELLFWIRSLLLMNLITPCWDPSFQKRAEASKIILRINWGGGDNSRHVHLHGTDTQIVRMRIVRFGSANSGPSPVRCLLCEGSSHEGKREDDMLFPPGIPQRMPSVDHHIWATKVRRESSEEHTKFSRAHSHWYIHTHIHTYIGPLYIHTYRASIVW